MLDLVSKRRYSYLFSSIFTIVGLVFIVATLVPNGGLGLQFSIAYTGGTVWEVHFEEGTPDPGEVRAILTDLGVDGEVAITTAGDREYMLLRTEALALAEAPAESDADPAVSAMASPGASPVADASAAPVPSASPDVAAAPAAADDADGSEGSTVRLPTEGRFGELATALQAAFGPIDEVRQQDSVGPVVSQELVWQTFLLVVMASLAIMAWVAYRFRDFRMGATALVALLHDVIIVVGVFAVLGTITGLQVDALFVTALLTVIGFSNHDTIVVFDRIRENRQRFMGEPLIEIVNYSMVQTIGRSLTTSLTLLVVLLALFMFGGEAIRPFILVMIIGVVAGAFSSIFVASPLFLDWHLWAEQRKVSQHADVKAQRSAA